MPIGYLSLTHVGMGEESRPSAATATGRRGPIDRHPVRGTGNSGARWGPRARRSPHPSSLHKALWGFTKKVSGREPLATPDGYPARSPRPFRHRWHASLSILFVMPRRLDEWQQESG